MGTDNDDDRPLIMCEYAHAMGQQLRNLATTGRDSVESCLQGGFIWEMLDHGILRTTDDGETYWAYAGTRRQPNDGNFVLMACSGRTGCHTRQCGSEAAIPTGPGHGG